MNGEIIWYNETKCYGFVRPTDGGNDIVFVLDAAEAESLATIRRGLPVHFMVRREAQGPVALRLSPGHVFEDAL